MIVSPLKRSLETAKYLKQLFKQNNKNVFIIVQPFLASRICSVWTIGSNLSELEKNYGNEGFNFVNFPEN